MRPIGCLRSDNLFRETVRLCKNQIVEVLRKPTHPTFCCPFWDAPDGNRNCDFAALKPGHQVFITDAIRSEDGNRIVGKVADCMYINLRVTYNKSNKPADIWYVTRVADAGHYAGRDAGYDTSHNAEACKS